MIQPVLGRSADIWGYPGSLILSGGIQIIAAPFLWLSRRQQPPADVATDLEQAGETPADLPLSGEGDRD